MENGFKVEKLALALILLLILGTAEAKMETVDLGPLKAEFNMGDNAKEHQIIINPPYQDQNRNSYWFRVESIEHPFNLIDVYIDDYHTPTDVSENKLMDEIEKYGHGDEKFDWKIGASAGGRPAVMAEVTDDEGSVRCMMQHIALIA